VQDLGGVSALPYYAAIDLEPRTTGNDMTRTLPVPASPTTPYTKDRFLPVHSARLSPGPVERRSIHAPGLPAIFLIGDDSRSRAWLRGRIDALRALHAVGLVVEVDSPQALQSLRRLAAGLTLTASPGDDLAMRLHLDHYPVLITATGIEP
jgi:integrating conjugative element protein (TIGR03765 family)